MINFKVELIKLLSCMDAVFKLLHVEVARKAIDGSEKKNGADIEMDYCPFEHKAGRAVQGSWARGAGELGSRGGELGSQAGALGSGARGTTRGVRGAQGRAALQHGILTLRHGRLGGHDMATARAWACPCALGCAAGPGCALGVPSLFFYLVLFLSHFMGTVHEHCSSQNFFKKKS